LKKYDGEPADFVMMFGGFNKFIPAMLVSLIQAAPWIVLQIISLFAQFAILFADIMGKRKFYQAEPIPDFSGIFTGTILIIFLLIMGIFLIISILIYITFFCAYPLLAEHNIGAIEAIKLSAKAGWSNFGGLLLLAVFQFLIGFVGMMLCGIGIFFVLPIIYGSTVVAYRNIFPKINAIPQNNKPPQPNEYGEMFGQGA